MDITDEKLDTWLKMILESTRIVPNPTAKEVQEQKEIVRILLEKFKIKFKE